MDLVASVLRKGLEKKLLGNKVSLLLKDDARYNAENIAESLKAAGIKVIGIGQVYQNLSPGRTEITDHKRGYFSSRFGNFDSMVAFEFSGKRPRINDPLLIIDYTGYKKGTFFNGLCSILENTVESAYKRDFRPDAEIPTLALFREVWNPWEERATAKNALVRLETSPKGKWHYVPILNGEILSSRAVYIPVSM
jgi:hypothetical protein